MRFFNILIVSVFFLLAAGCGGKEEKLNLIPQDGVILAFGDSLTYGTGAKPDSSYPSVLQQLTGRKVVNAGIPGEQTAAGLKRLPDLLDAHSPNLMILIHGGNDMLKKRSLDAAADNLKSMITTARERNTQVVMLAVPNPTLLLSPADFYEEVAESLGVPIDLKTLAKILQYPDTKSDTVHPNAKGYRIMAENIHELLKSRGAL